MCDDVMVEMVGKWATTSSTSIKLRVNCYDFQLKQFVISTNRESERKCGAITAEIIRRNGSIFSVQQKQLPSNFGVGRRHIMD